MSCSATEAHCDGKAEPLPCVRLMTRTLTGHLSNQQPLRRSSRTAYHTSYRTLSLLPQTHRRPLPILPPPNAASVNATRLAEGPSRAQSGFRTLRLGLPPEQQVTAAQGTTKQRRGKEQKWQCESVRTRDVCPDHVSHPRSDDVGPSLARLGLDDLLMLRARRCG